ncbi:MAG: phosphatidylserine/phosphatidylglycerophosphate/cardiolipin synthase family protein [Bacteroidetes bacterium]|nr:phosphatidylserine/phosphatidylglycerophosphate/cardiolipin synthase family protein [Bacteroidota bacterium]
MKSLIKEISIINEGTIPFPILPNGSGWKSTEKEKLSVIESGEGKVLLSKIIKAIDSAKQMVCFQSFLIQDTEIIDSLIKAVEERDVKVFVLSSAEARLKETIEEEEDFIKANYIQLLETKFKNHFIHRTAEYFHGKYILVDPKSKPKGFICTNNFTENGFTQNPELAVELNNEQCEELFKVFVYHFWEHSTDEQTATKEFAKVKPVNKFSLPKLDNILLTSPNSKGNSLNKTLLAAINKVEKTISFSTFQIDKNTELVKAITDKAKQNVSVTLFCRSIEKQFNEQLKELLEAGIRIYFHPLTHSKSLLIDNKDGFVFTANFIANGLDYGFEVGVKLNEEQTNDLSTIHQSWQDNFPAKAIKVAKVKDLKEIQVFKDRKLTTKQLLNDSKTENRKILKVADLFSLFNQPFTIKDSSIKTLKVILTAEIEELPEKYKANGADKFEVIEVEEDKGKKSKFVVINGKFEHNDINNLSEWKDLKIYTVQP